ncbi:MAG: hypothetical protein AAFO77_06360 [Pseudomonadota bacterium]
MTNEKPWYLSKTIWGAAVSIAATVGSMLGVPFNPAEQGAMTDAILQTVAAVAGIFAIFGRLTASEKLS